MAQIIGTPHDDHLTGTSVTDSPTGADDIFGLAGDDRIDGRSGDDRLFGGPGADQLVGSLGDDLLFGEDDDDLLRGGPGDDQLFGGIGRDVVLGDDGDDLLIGDPGDDDLLGGIGDDRLEGGDGNDNLFGDAGDDHLNGGPGLDRHQGGPGEDRFGLSDLDAADEILDFHPDEGDGLEVARLVQDALDAGASFAEVVRVEVTPAGTLVALDPDGSGFRDAALLRGVALTAAQLGLDLPSPVAVDDSASTNQSTTITIDPLANDQGQGDRLTIVGLDATETRGGVAISPDGLTITYTPDPASFGIDTFRYTVANSLGETAEAAVRVGVLGTAELADIARDDDPRGFALTGVSAFDLSGYSISGADDVDGDGFADIVLGAYDADPTGASGAGQSYVVFGKAEGAAVELAEVVQGLGGFALNGPPVGVGGGGFYSGFSVSGAGDVDGDGLADVIIGSMNEVGGGFVVFGKEDGATVELDEVIMGSGGFALFGARIFDGFSTAVSGAGDVNGDGLADVILGAPRADPTGMLSFAEGSGQSYVVFGKADGTAVQMEDVVQGAGGFAMNGITVADSSGASVSGAGDVNGDGLADVILGAPRADPTGMLSFAERSGQSYVVFGKADGTAVQMEDVVQGAGGFAMNGIAVGDNSGASVSGAGDVIGDGLADVIVGASGQSYVVFGKGDGTSVELADVAQGIGGFAINGIAEGLSGRSVSGAGDVNGDGLADIIVGAAGADANGFRSGQSYVVFGKADGAAVELEDIAQGIDGFALDGIAERDFSGMAVSGAGDVNGDGFADISVGAARTDANGVNSGQSYVVFGGDFTASVDLLGTEGDDHLIGTAEDEIIVGAQGDDTLIGNGGVDLLNGAAGDDLLALGDLGFRQLQGGTGFDTVRLDTAGASLDLTTVPDPFAQGIEAFDLAGGGNALVLDTLEILNIADDSNALFVFGDGTNAVQGDLGGASVGAATVDGVDFQTFTLGQAELFVQTGVDASGVETAIV